MTVCKVSTVPVYKKKKRLVISGKVKCLSTSLAVLQYFHGSTVVLPRQYFSTAKEVLGLDKTLSISSFLSGYNHRLFHQSVVAVLKVQVLSLGR